MLKSSKIKQTLAKLVALPSISNHLTQLDQSNRAVAERLANWLQDTGFVVEIMSLPGHPDKVNVLASLGQGSGGLVLAGTDEIRK
jgi:acetylornithine deacetylase